MNIMQNQFTIGLAGLIIEVDTISPRTCILCREYLQDGEPDFKIKVTKEDIYKEYIASGCIKNNEINLETLAAYRKIVEKALYYDTILMHGAVIAIGNNSYMFSAPSGTGKTTHIKLWLNNVDGCYVVNGDKPLIRIQNDKVYACGTPWSGNEHLNKNVITSLKSIVIMERAECNSIEKISFSQVYPYLIQQTFRPRDVEKVKKVLSLLSRLYGKVSFWRFQCNNFNDDCFEVAYNALTNQTNDI